MIMKYLLITLLIFSASCSTLSPNAFSSKSSNTDYEKGSKNLTFKKVLTFSVVCIGLYYLFEDSETKERVEDWSDATSRWQF